MHPSGVIFRYVNVLLGRVQAVVGVAGESAMRSPSELRRKAAGNSTVQTTTKLLPMVSRHVSELRSFLRIAGILYVAHHACAGD